MRVALFSDSHGDAAALRIAMEAAMKHGRIDLFAFLGDGVQDFYDLMKAMKKHNPSAILQAVRGNNDYAMFGLREEAVIKAENLWLFLAHGHRQRVKLTYSMLMEDAKDRQCHAALFGHTHRTFCEEREGILLFNPGSVSLPVGSGPTAGILEISPEGVLKPQILHLQAY
jgi:putative phosphoesterase